ncbi:glycosyltransferase family 2 protein [Micrococcus terreus]|uniref:glycosyltransferase family 2 protein n=1 Tax=Micrococcus terreus TaxID=574650 RepID=UPI003D7591E5
MDVSVIIPVLNGERTIGRQLGALARQETELKWEVLVADNGSTDGTRELVERFSQDFPVRLTLVDARARRSAAYARNCGARASSGAVLAFCDADDQVDVRWVQAAYEASLTAPVSTGLIRYLTEPFDPESEIFNPRILHGRGIFGANFVARREVFFEVGGFDESLPPYRM